MRHGAEFSYFAFFVTGALVAVLGANANAEPTFTDVTLAAGITHIHGEFPSGVELMTGGAAIGDYNGDGFEDIYVTRADATDILYKNRGDGTFEDVTAAAGLTINASTNGAAWADVDNDGDLDLYVSCVNCFAYYLFINDGTGFFTEEAEIRGAAVATGESHNGFSVTVGDYDNDGWLDIHVTEWLGYNNSPGNVNSNQRLLRNLGAPAPVGTGEPGYFEDVTVSAGVWNAPEDTTGYSNAFVDLDEDGWLDLTITADHARTQVFWNDQNGGFVDGTDPLVFTDNNGMGTTFGDYDGDGDLDWFVSTRNDNRVYEYIGSRQFADSTDYAGVRNGFWGWGAVFFDYDNDGDLDLSQTNGWASPPENRIDPMRFWENDGTGVMTEKSALVGLTDTGIGLGQHTFDYDRDGDLDLFIARNGVAPILYRNDGGNERDWLRVRLMDSVSGNGGLHARLTLVAQAGDAPQVRVMGVGSHFLGHSERVAHFGLNSLVADGPTTVYSLTIDWPDGSSQTLNDLPSSIEILVAEDEAPIFVPNVVGLADVDATTALTTAGFVLGEVTTRIDTSVAPGSVLEQNPPAGYLAPTGWHVDLVLASPPPPNQPPMVNAGADLLATELGDCAPESVHGSVARQWNEELLAAIRLDFARPTVHARNLYHVSAAMWDAWAAYDPTATQIFHIESGSAADVEAARNEAISYAVYRILSARFANSPGAPFDLPAFDARMLALGYDKDNTTLEGPSAAALGNRIAATILDMGMSDGANEANDYANLFYESINPPLLPDFPGNPDLIYPNRWQPLALQYTVDQSGNVIPGGFPGFLSPEWGAVTPFSLTADDLTIYPDGNGNFYWVYHDPGPPPMLGGVGDALYKSGFEQVVLWSGLLDPEDGVMIDISPNSRGNNTLGTNDGHGRALNPRTGLPYVPQIVPAGDYYRVLAEFWADGPDSETPPGHWFTIANYVSDHPLVQKRYGGAGQELNELEWDVKLYLTLGGAMHDCAVSAWGIKGWYDYIRPVSAIRYMAERGQSSDPGGPSYDPTGHGITLYPGQIEVVTAESILPGERHEHLAGENNENIGKIAVYAWRGPDYIVDPGTDTAGVGWILAENWWPYQRPSFVTPPFAGYVSGHSTFSRAAATVMHHFTGDEFFPGGVGTFFAPQNEFLVFEEGPSVDITLEWATYYDASDETSISRIYGGIHPTADDIPGRLIGAEIGLEAFDYAQGLFPAEAGGLPCPAIVIHGTVDDDGYPSDTLDVAWSVVSGPGIVNFGDPNSPVTTAAFSAVGVYELMLEASDGEYTSSDTMLVTVADGSIQVTRPNGGETLVHGQVEQITWNSSGSVGNVKISINRVGGNLHVITPSTENDGSFSWTVPAYPISDDYTIRIESIEFGSVYDESDALFSISNTPPAETFAVLAPNGGEVYVLGDTVAVTWFTDGTGGSDVEILLHNSAGTSTIAASTPNDGLFNWTVPSTQPLGSDYTVEVRSLSDPGITDSSDGPFSIADAPPAESITVLSPNGGETLIRGQIEPITWTSTGIAGSVKIIVDKGGSTRVISNSTANDGSFNWNVPLYTVGSNYKIRIESVDSPAIYDVSDSTFSLADTPPGNTLTVLTPNGGELYLLGDIVPITWDSGGAVGADVEILLHDSGGMSTIAASTPNDGAFDWEIPLGQAVGADYTIEVRSLTDPGITDSSNGPFTITDTPPAETITLVSPNGGEIFVPGQAVPINWTSSGVVGNVKISIHLAGKPPRLIASSTANDGSYSWTVPTYPAGSEYSIRIESVTSPTVFDVSDGPFSIQR